MERGTQALRFPSFNQRQYCECLQINLKTDLERLVRPIRRITHHARSVKVKGTIMAMPAKVSSKRMSQIISSHRLRNPLDTFAKRVAGIYHMSIMTFNF